MEEEFYTVEKISKLLNIHPKTIQRYIREGKLRATKIGKSWRISGHDLSCFTEDQGRGHEQDVTIQEKERAKASSVIDLKVNDKEEADRIINSLTAVMNVKPAEYGQASLNTQYIEQEKIVRIMLWGTLSFLISIGEMIELFMEQE